MKSDYLHRYHPETIDEQLITKRRGRYLLPLIRWRISKAGFWLINIPYILPHSCLIEIKDKFGWPYSHRNIDCSSIVSVSEYIKILPDHMPAWFVQKLLGEDLWRKIFTFSMVRNPWDKLLSCYFHDRGFFPSKFLVNMSFQKHAFLYLSSSLLLLPLELFLCDEENKILVDFVAKYENMQEDLAYVGEQIGLSTFGSTVREILVDRSAKQDLMHRKYDYREYYNDELRDQVAEIFRWEIEQFNYTFDPPENPG